MTTETTEHAHRPDHGHDLNLIHVRVGGEPFTTEASELTPNDIIKDFAGKDPTTHYLVQIRGHEKISYQGQGGIPISMRDGMRFQVISKGPTPVSDGTTASVEKFMVGLIALGYEPAIVPGKPDRLSFDYELGTGRFAGRKVRLGLVVPQDFPATPPSGPHVCSHIHPVGRPGGHPTGAIHASDFGSEWQYWSRPYPEWASSKRTVAAYMSHIWRLWDSQ